MHIGGEHKEARSDDSFHKAISFAPASCLLDAEHQPVTIAHAIKLQLREYTETPYPTGSLIREYGAEGPRILVGAFKTAILRRCDEWLRENGDLTQVPIHVIKDACKDALPKNKTLFDISVVSEIPYVPHPDYASGDKPRLPYRPDFDAIDRLYDKEAPADWHICRAFYESLYAVQKFAAGIRDDVYGGSELVPPKPSWENKGVEPDPAVTHTSEALTVGLVARRLMKKLFPPRS